MNTEMLVAILIFVFSVIALLALGARAFTRLVELILENGSKVVQLHQAIRQAPIVSLTALEDDSGSLPQVATPTTQEEVSTRSTANIAITKSRKS